jgi:hypothetical protein
MVWSVVGVCGWYLREKAENIDNRKHEDESKMGS